MIVMKSISRCSLAKSYKILCIKHCFRNPLELTICEDIKNDQVKFAKLSITLSSSMGFTNAIAYHFYEKGYGLHEHTVEKVYELRNMDGTQIIGDISLRLKLTCHGPETKHTNQILLKSERPRMQPIFVDGNAFDFPFDKHVIQPPPKMMYDNINRMEVFNPDIKELLHCQRCDVKFNFPISRYCFHYCLCPYI